MMAKGAQGTFKCSRCNRTFSMAMHLARHTSAMHGSKKRKTAKRRKAAKRRGRPAAKARRGRGRRRVGRPKGVASRLGLRNLTLDQLSQLIEAAHAEARRKIAELEKVWG